MICCGAGVQWAMAAKGKTKIIRVLTTLSPR